MAETAEKEQRFTTTQVAKKLQVSARVVVNWINAGKIHTIKTLGGHNRITETELERVENEMRGKN